MKAGHPQAIDLSLKNHIHDPDSRSSSPPAVLLKPEPRPAWSILWYRSIWPKIPVPQPVLPSSTFDLSSLPGQSLTQLKCRERSAVESTTCEELENDNYSSSSKSKTFEALGVDLTLRKGDADQEGLDEDSKESKSTAAVTDVATCDGPVHFQRVSNPNFALTVEHREKSDLPLSPPLLPAPPSKTYLCIYCNQSFKSLFCYQKHKKRHLNPVSVDIAPHPNLELTHSLSENNLRTTDLNVQFFPCKKCGSKFPSYYFVHKHKRVCDIRAGQEGTVTVDYSGHITQDPQT